MLIGERLTQIFEDYHGEVLKAIDSCMTLLSQATPQDTQDRDIAESEDVFPDITTEEVSKTAAKKKTNRLCTYEGRMWHVPKNFIFPTNAKLLTGCQLRIRGQPGYELNRELEGVEVAI